MDVGEGKQTRARPRSPLVQPRRPPRAAGRRAGPHGAHGDAGRDTGSEAPGSAGWAGLGRCFRLDLPRASGVLGASPIWGGATFLLTAVEVRIPSPAGCPISEWAAWPPRPPLLDCSMDRCPAITAHRWCLISTASPQLTQSNFINSLPQLCPSWQPRRCTAAGFNVN